MGLKIGIAGFGTFLQGDVDLTQLEADVAVHDRDNVRIGSSTRLGHACININNSLQLKQATSFKDIATAIRLSGYFIWKRIREDDLKRLAGVILLMTDMDAEIQQYQNLSGYEENARGFYNTSFLVGTKK